MRINGIIQSNLNSVKVGLIGLMGCFSSESWASEISDSFQASATRNTQTQCADMSNEQQRKISRSNGIPTLLRTGGDVLVKEESKSSEIIYKPLGAELKERYPELHADSLEKEYLKPISAYDERLLPPSITSVIPADIIISQAFSQKDGLFETAIKLERLGLLIKDIPSDKVDAQTYSQRSFLMAQCFSIAGGLVDKYLKLLEANDQKTMDIEEWLDIYRSGGIFYRWAAQHMPSPSKELMSKRGQKLLDDAKMLQEAVNNGLL